MAAKSFTGLPLDGSDPERVHGHGEHAFGRVDGTSVSGAQPGRLRAGVGAPRHLEDEPPAHGSLISTRSSPPLPPATLTALISPTPAAKYFSSITSGSSGDQSLVTTTSV